MLINSGNGTSHSTSGSCTPILTTVARIHSASGLEFVVDPGVERRRLDDEGLTDTVLVGCAGNQLDLAGRAETVHDRELVGHAVGVDRGVAVAVDQRVHVTLS